MCADGDGVVPAGELPSNDALVSVRMLVFQRELPRISRRVNAPRAIVYRTLLDARAAADPNAVRRTHAAGRICFLSRADVNV